MQRHAPPAWRATATAARTAAMTRPSGALRGEGVKRRPYRTPRCLSRQQRTKRWWDQDRSHLGAAPAMLRITPTSKQSWRDSSASHAQIRRRKHTCASAPRTIQLSDRTSRCEGHRFEGATAGRSDVVNCSSAAPAPCQTASFYSASAISPCQQHMRAWVHSCRWSPPLLRIRLLCALGRMSHTVTLSQTTVASYANSNGDARAPSRRKSRARGSSRRERAATLAQRKASAAILGSRHAP